MSPYAFTLSDSGSFVFVSGEISEFLFFRTRELKKKKPTLLKRKKEKTSKIHISKQENSSQ